MSTVGASDSRLNRVMPLVGTVRSYRWSWLGGDSAAALTVWALVVPESVAYAGIAGLPPQTGLYVATIPLLVYALFGTSRRITYGPTAAVAALSFATVSQFADPGSEEFLAYSVLLAMVAGLLLLVAGIARWGIIAEFLSEPVLKGFLVGVGLTVAIGQVDKILRVDPEGGDAFFGQAVALIRELPELHVPSLILGVAALVLLWLLHRYVPRVPAALVVVLLGVLATTALDLESRGVEVVGEIPAEFPLPDLPGLGWDAVVSLMPGAIGMIIVVYAETMALAKSFASKHGERVDGNHELTALGVANLSGGLFGGFASAGSNSRSAAAEAAGQKTQISSLIVVSLLLLTILFLTPLFTNLPEPVLGAIVIHAVMGLITLRPIAVLRVQYRNDYTVAVATLVAVLLFEILGGLLIGVLLSIGQLMQRAVRPKVTPLGLDPASGTYRSVEDQTGVQPVEGMIILRFEAELFFANVSVLRERLLFAIEARDVYAVVIDAEAITQIDTTAATELGELIDAMDEQDVRYAFARLRHDVSDLLRRCGIDVTAHEYRRVADAVYALQTEHQSRDN